ncbi:MAG TPA: hydantoinase/oxoprolinase family protein [Candidatus Dormibacteraeota bacterium]|nr:hydantoinase/oxoprolinase family protein [Candidatus Dormibacteraeota bacterium]
MGPVTRSGTTRAKGYAIALDVGGTFTDVALVHEASGRLWVTKTPTTPHDPSAGFMAGIDRALQLAGIEAAALRHVLHGTTTATNAILEGKGAAIGLLTTAGFRDVLEIGRHDIPRRANMFAWVKPARPVAPELIFEIGGRVTVDGAEIEPLDEEAVRAAARRLRAAGVDSIAVCFLHSYANPAHERRARALLLEEHPGGAVSLSSEVLPVFREFERSMGTVLNAYVQPLVGRYVARLVGELRPRGIGAPLSIMKSNGGVIGADVVRTQAIHTALSGPAAGVIGARRIGEAAGFDDLISVDVGGTSADVCLVRGGEAEVTTEGRVGAWPLHVPMIDIHTIGAGGGSIARVTEDGTLTVGPESAGAQPGPVCYGAGGEEPTVTDAHLVLGRIPSHLLGGEIPLDVERARRAIEEHVARPLGLPLAAAAQGILDILNNNMVGALRLVSVERGYDPRDFVLVPFGGAGPLHGADLATLLGMRTVVVPRHPGVLSTFGLLGTEVRNDYARTSLQKPPDYDIGAVAAVYADLEGQARDWLVAEGVAPSARRLTRMADLRYRHQGFELTVPWPERDLDLDALLARFHARHRQLYTYALADAPVEIVTLRLAAAGRVRRFTLPSLPRRRMAAARPPRRRVHFPGAGWTMCPSVDRERLGVGAVVTGPAIVEQPDTTTVVPPGHRARVDRVGNLVIQTGRSPSPLRGEGRVRGRAQ